MVTIFFYGLFMDKALLEGKGFKPVNPRSAYVENFQLRIGKRASLVRKDGFRAYGILMNLSSADVEKLYSDSSVADYLPEPIVCELLTGGTDNGLVYNLSESKLEGKNTKYAKMLVEVLTDKEFPNSYVKEVANWVE